MAGALVLNATYEPIGVVPARRALVLVLDKKVDVLACTDDTASSERLRLEVPSVVRLRKYRSLPYRRVAALNRKAVFARDHGLCQYCGKKAESIDHVIPLSRGGAHSWENVVACCTRCNSYKGDRMLANCGLKLSKPPRMPRRYLWIIVAVGSVPKDWLPFIEQSAT